MAGIFLSLAAVASGLPVPTTVTLGNLVQPYDGKPKLPAVATIPSDVPYQVVYRNPAVPAVSQVVYDDSPAALDLSYLSYAFAAQDLSGLGNYLQLGGSARRLQACETILVTWAKAEDWPELAAANPAGYYHPVKVSLYEVSATNQLVFLTEASHPVFIPWRPLTMPNGQPYRYNGHAFRAVIPFPDGITLPERVMVMVNFNTQSTGFNPIGVPGPYNTLNVALESASVSSGSDVNPDVVLQIKSDVWYYPSTGWAGSSAPMFRIKALSTDSITPPVKAGTYQATARVSNPDYSGSATGEFRIGENLASWIQPWVQSGAIDASATGDRDDPDGDSLSNLIEYGGALDPSSGNHGLTDQGSPRVECTAGEWSMIYRRNLAAGDLDFTVETTTQLDESQSWSPAATVDTIVATEGAVQTIRATLAQLTGETRRFMRLRVSRR